MIEDRNERHAGGRDSLAGVNMKLIVLSDTHIREGGKALPEPVTAALAGAGHIIHAGDIQSPMVLEQLSAYAPVTAVAGNMDPPELRWRLGEKLKLCVGGFVFGVCHGHGTTGKTLERAMACFPQDDVHAIIFGHSHIPYCAYHGGVLLFNPGSPTDKRRNECFSFGVIETGETLSARIVYFDARGVVREGLAV